MRIYKVIDEDRAVNLGLAEKNPYQYTSYLVEFSVDGVALIGQDGGEPEDQTLGRDWKWVVSALQRAYDAGVADAKPGLL